MANIGVQNAMETYIVLANLAWGAGEMRVRRG